MKKIYYLLLLLPLAFTACQKQPNLIPASYTKAMTLTLQASDYQLLPKTDYPYNTLTFDNVADANTYIPIILNARDPQLGNGSTAKVTYTVSSPYLKVADSVYADVAYTLTKADYLLLPGNKYSDFSIAQVLSWLPYKYPTPVANQLAVLTFSYYNVSTTTATFSFLYLNGAWQQIYQVTAAQYTSLGLGGYDQFTASNNANLAGLLNALLKADPLVSASAKYGQVEYVSFNYYGGGTFQRVVPLVFDGNNWVGTATTTNTLAFLKSGGTWIPDPTVYYTLSSADLQLIAASTFGTTAQRTDVGKYGDFSAWAAADLDNAIILALTKDFPTPKVNVNYNVTYLNYTGGADVPTVVTFQYNGTAWVAK
ncbi:hypothetical protein HDF24_09730 [Mucilaginibacter sp. X4EP1]|uniref:hypothetical protein n=1 Tax=Mucilaginibacter sp. X4EP1 TaxID=2723092 RepID=UPI0021685AEB|nr:hypothetical protein [Mucilaginibacter sp. X4EP1]MCS3816592.1 hypothetical protein [Mucilaginibacter sp. X4EP1]